jgi:hypothetical protein
LKLVGGLSGETGLRLSTTALKVGMMGAKINRMGRCAILGKQPAQSLVNSIQRVKAEIPPPYSRLICHDNRRAAETLHQSNPFGGIRQQLYL